MCSIAGSHKRKEVETMLSVMEHRAPDDTGLFEFKDFTMGMGRLKILDLTSKNLCPIKDGNLVLSFNGEIYNYQELKKELSHVKFKTTSDSEVLLEAYKAWGTDCLQKLNGMFAFAIYDSGKIFFARDIAGEKPLYYTKSPFRFASEAKALSFNCEELPNAHCGIYDTKTEELKTWRWWHPEKKEVNRETATDELEKLLEDSVRLRTQSDVPYGLYLSGGVDSTLISTFHDFKETFSYEDQDYEEEFKEALEKIVWHLDYPIKSFSAFGLWKLAQEASKKVKVVLSGEGADELFGGYVRFVPNEFNRQAAQAFPSYTNLFPFKEDMFTDEFEGNMQELLRMGDRMASAFGIENRCPFLDKRIIEFAHSLPIDMKVDGLETKKILRQILKKRKPDYEFEEKHGLYCSVNEWLGSDEKFDKTRYTKTQEDIWKTFW